MSNKTVQQLINENKITSQQALSQFLIGKTVTVNVDGHAYNKKGAKVKVDGTWIIMYGNPRSYFYLASNSGILYYLDQVAIGDQSLKSLEESITENDKEIKRLQSENELTDQKISFMKENKMDTYDDDVFKVLEVLHALEAKSGTKLEKAMAIAKIIKGS